MNHDEIKMIAKTLKDGDVINISYNITILGNVTDSFRGAFADGAITMLFISEIAASDASVSVVSRAIPREPETPETLMLKSGKPLLVLDKHGVPWRKGTNGAWQSFETNDIFEWEDMYRRFGPVTIYLPDRGV